MGDGTSKHHDYWDSFYRSRTSKAVPEEPSAFARWVEPQLSREQVVVEVGFGTARDSTWLMRQGHDVLGFDFAESAVHHAQGHTDAQGLAGTFSRLDLYDTAAVKEAARDIGDRAVQPALYGRFLIHSLEDSGRHNLFDLAASVLAEGGALYLEFRTGLDREGEHIFGDDHFRVYLDPALVVTEIKERGGTVTDSCAGHGLAVYKTEDPHVARIVARWADE